MEPIFNLATVIITLLTAGYLYYKWRRTYWQRTGLPLMDSIPAPEPSTKEPPFTRNGIIQTYRKIKDHGLKHAGGYRFTSTMYFPVDNEIIRNIFQTDFDHFTDHGSYINERDDPMSGNLFNLEGAKWRNVRAKLSPTFTSGKKYLNTFCWLKPTYSDLCFR